MKLFDISQEIFSSAVYPGDKGPRKYEDMSMSRGDLYNLSSFEMGSHNGTHLDAPFHFFHEGKTVEQIPLEKTVGSCYVSRQDTTIDAAAAKYILKKARDAATPTGSHCFIGHDKRILIKGTGVVTEEAARVFADAGVFLIGVESQTVGPEDAPMAVHKLLLKAEVVLLEGLRLTEVEEGSYFLSAAPILLGGCDGAPCRAVLIQK